MLQGLLRLRYVMGLAALGAAVGALLMFWVGGEKVIAAVGQVFVAHDKKAAIANIMGATDAFLFGIVLVVFAYGIAFGFVVRLSEADELSLPGWMRVHNLSDLKHRLIEVIVLYLIVDFASDWADGVSVGWEALVKPISIILIAAASRIMAGGHGAAGGKP